jgi:hypothetical protein
MGVGCLMNRVEHGGEGGVGRCAFVLEIEVDVVEVLLQGDVQVTGGPLRNSWMNLCL